MDLRELLYKILGKDKKTNNIGRTPKDTYLKISNFFKKENINKEEVIIVCIGTNRKQTIDCLGPFVGSILKEDREFNIPIYGTMVNPIHSLNITESITEIKSNHPRSIIIAIDAALGQEEQIGEIEVSELPIIPGSEANKKHETVGDYSIKGYVGPSGIKVSRYDTDLDFITSMAYIIVKGLKESLEI